MNADTLSGPNVPAILAAREAVRAILAPTGADLEALLMRLHAQSAQSQRKARKSQQKLRDELYRRLDEGQTLVIHGNEVVVSMVTNRELIRAMEAESNLIKVEAMAQRSYTVHRVIQRAASPPGGSLEEFLDRLEQEEMTEAPDVESPPDW